MAAPVGKTVGASERSDDSSSSSSDDEALRRCQEAVWDTRTHTEKDDNKVKESKRVVVADHEHDGNELQVTKGFQTHVAKKLGSFLDSHISEVQVDRSSGVEAAKDDDDDDEDDEGFRLFSTSVPGRSAEEPPAPVPRRPIPSSSDSDSEMETRLKEAAVSFKDLVPSFASAPASTELPCTEENKKKKKKKQKAAETEEAPLSKKKRSEQPQLADSSNTQSNGEHTHSPQGLVKVKKKKKKQREEALN